jgi:hypothetical protein
MERNYSCKLRSKLGSLHKGSTLASSALQWPFSSLLSSIHPTAQKEDFPKLTAQSAPMLSNGCFPNLG